MDNNQKLPTIYEEEEDPPKDLNEVPVEPESQAEPKKDVEKLERKKIVKAVQTMGPTSVRVNRVSLENAPLRHWYSRLHQALIRHIRQVHVAQNDVLIPHDMIEEEQFEERSRSVTPETVSPASSDYSSDEAITEEIG